MMTLLLNSAYNAARTMRLLSITTQQTFHVLLPSAVVSRGGERAIDWGCSMNIGLVTNDCDLFGQCSSMIVLHLMHFMAIGNNISPELCCHIRRLYVQMEGLVGRADMA
eukprot:scaffold105550_cov26-Prasinocladus_malaysianus.AAC.1